MSRTVQGIAVSASVLLLAVFVVFVVNQTAQVVELAETAVPGAGRGACKAAGTVSAGPLG